MKLYEIEAVYQALMDRAEENEGDITDFVHEFEEIRAEFKDKAENYWRMIKNLTAEADALKAEKQRLEKKQKAKENTVQFLKDRLADSMRFMGEDKVKTAFGSLSFRRSQSVDIADLDLLPDEFIKVVKTASKAAISEAIKQGKEVPGAVIKESYSLQVR